MIKAVLFDMDGVISDTEKIHYLSYKRAFQQLGYEITHPLYVDKLQARSREEGIKNIIEDPSEDQINIICDFKDIFYKEELSKGIEPYSDTFILINELMKTGIKMAVVSASKYAEYQISTMKLLDYFDFVVSGTDTLNIRNKPYPDIYLYALEKLGLKPSEVIIIEDSYNGVQSALGSGARVVGINRGYLSFKKHPNLLIVDDLRDVVKLLN